MLTACGFGFNVGEDGVDVEVEDAEDAGENNVANIIPPNNTLASYGYPRIIQGADGYDKYIVPVDDNGMVTYNILATGNSGNSSSYYTEVHIYVFASETSHTQLKIISGTYAFNDTNDETSYNDSSNSNASHANGSHADRTKQYSSSHGKFMLFKYWHNNIKVGDETIIEVENSVFADTYRFKLRVVSE